jgi:hypothetical protein
VRDRCANMCSAVLKYGAHSYNLHGVMVVHTMLIGSSGCGRAEISAVLAVLQRSCSQLHIIITIIIMLPVNCNCTQWALFPLPW